MPDLRGEPAPPPVHLAAENQAAADPGAERYQREVGLSPGCTVGQLAGGGARPVVVGKGRHREEPRKVLLNRTALKGRDVLTSADQEPFLLVDETGGPDANDRETVAVFPPCPAPSCPAPGLSAVLQEPAEAALNGREDAFEGLPRVHGHG